MVDRARKAPPSWWVTTWSWWQTLFESRRGGGMTVLTDAPRELQVAIQEFWPADQWDNAASVAALESRWDAFAVDDTTDAQHPCGAYLRTVDGVRVVAERSVGYFQINSCNYPDWEWQRLYNARHNAGTAHMLWAAANGWGPWFFSASVLGLL